MSYCISFQGRSSIYDLCVLDGKSPPDHRPLDSYRGQIAEAMINQVVLQAQISLFFFTGLLSKQLDISSGITSQAISESVDAGSG